MKLLVVGSRALKNIDISIYIPTDTDIIISGGASGVDSLAEKYADDNRLSKLILRPNYKRYGKAAPIRRNYEMVDLSDKIIAFWDGRSRGTKATIEYAKKRQKDIEIILTDDL